MPDEINKTDISASETAEEEKETLETEGEETTEGEGSETTDESTDESTDSFYEDQLKELQTENDRLKAEAEDRMEQIAIKDRALRKRNQPQPRVASGEEDLTPSEKKLLARIEQKQQRDRVETLAKSFARSEAEQKLVLHHYDNSIVKTGNVENDAQRALAIANAARIQEILGREDQEEAQEDRQIRSMGGGNMRTPSKSSMKSNLRKEVEKLIPKEARKHLDTYVPR